MQQTRTTSRWLAATGWLPAACRIWLQRRLHEPNRQLQPACFYDMSCTIVIN